MDLCPCTGINAYVYMVLGRMVYLFLPDRKIYRVKAQSLAKYFVWLDIFSFIMQGTGGSMITPDASQATVMLGIHIYMGGIGLQEFFILVFCALLFIFYRRTSDLTRTGVQTGKEGWKALSWTLGAVLIMITVTAPPFPYPSTQQKEAYHSHANLLPPDTDHLPPRRVRRGRRTIQPDPLP